MHLKFKSLAELEKFISEKNFKSFMNELNEMIIISEQDKARKSDKSRVRNLIL